MPRAALLAICLIVILLGCRSVPVEEAPGLAADFQHRHPTVDAYLKIASYRAAQGDRAGALAAIDSAARRVPTSGAAQLARAELLAQSSDADDLTEAREILEAITATHPEAPGLDRARATLALGSGDPEAAWDAVQPALADGSDPLAEALAAEILLERGDELEAIRHADRALDRKPGYGRALATRAAAHQRLGDDSAAAADARAALRSRRQDGALRLLLVESQLRMGKLRSARRSLELLEPGARSARSERISGAIALAGNDTAAAREAYERSLELAPADGDSLRALAALDLYEDDSPAVLERLANDPSSAAAILRARALFASDRSDEAGAELRALLHAEPNEIEPWGLLLELAPPDGSPEDRAQQVWDGPGSEASSDTVPGALVLAALLADDEAHVGALYDAALAQRPGLPLAANNRASQLLDAGVEPDRALQLAQAAHDGSGGAPVMADTLGQALLATGQPGEAILVLSRGLASAEPRDELSRILRARRALALEANGETVEALSAADDLLRKHRRAIEAAEKSGETPPREPSWLSDAQAVHDRLAEAEPEAPSPAIPNEPESDTEPAPESDAERQPDEDPEPEEPTQPDEADTDDELPPKGNDDE